MSSFVKIPCWYAMQLFFMFFEKRVAYFSCFATLLGEFRHKNNSFCLVWDIALHWEWKIFLRMQRFWTLEAICVAWSKLPARWCAKESSNLSRYTTQAMQPCRQSLLGHGLSPHKLRHATSQAEPARSRAVTLYYTSHATSQAKPARSRAVTLYYTSHATSQAEPARSRAVAL